MFRALISTASSRPYRAAALRDPLALFLIALIASTLGTLLTRAIGGTTAIWPANGLVLGFLLSSRSHGHGRRIAAVFLGNLAADTALGDSRYITLVLAACNTLEIAVAAWLLRRRLGRAPDLTEPRILWGFCLLGVVPGPLLSSLTATGLMTLIGHARPLAIFTAWFYADTLAIAIFTPLVLILRSNEAGVLFRRHRLRETVGVLASVALAAILVFQQSRYPVLYMIYAPLMLAVFRLGFAGLVLSLILVLGIALGYTVAGMGPFMLIPGADVTERVLSLQLFLAASLLLCFPVATVLAQRDRARHELERRASRDGLTGLFNRPYFDAALEREWRRVRRTPQECLSLLMIDVDHFKAYNDRYGHPAGDACLKAVARVLAETARRDGDVAARYGGEEFALILPNTPAANAALLAERLRGEVEALALGHAGSPLGVTTVSIGTATWGPDLAADRAQASPADLIAAADRALYLAKRQGRNRIADAQAAGSWDSRASINR